MAYQPPPKSTRNGTIFGARMVFKIFVVETGSNVGGVFSKTTYSQPTSLHNSFLILFVFDGFNKK